MRRKDREITDFTEIVSVFKKCKIITLAMISEGIPYSVPINFGFEVQGEKIVVYFHGAGKGKKIDALRKNPNVSFSAFSFADVDSFENPQVPCNWTCFYESVIGFGNVEFLKSKEEKARALDSIMIHNGYKLPIGIKKIAYNAMEFANTAVGKIVVEKISGKRHKRKN